jgi:malate dehydrogenase
MFATRFASQTTARSVAATRAMSTKVAVLGAGGGIGQPLSMLLKLSPHVDELSCYDIVGTPGVAADLSHVSGSEYRDRADNRKDACTI